MLRRLQALSPSDLTFFILSCLYLAAEFRFNFKLLDVAGDAAVDSAAIHGVADFGRAVAGFGFTLLTLGVFTRFAFRLKTPGARRIFAVFACICGLSFLAFPPAGLEMLFILPVVFGGVLIAVSRGRSPVYVIVGLVLMAWPTMFVAQRSVVEHVVIAPTSWQDRAHARNVLLLKSGLEHCVVEIADHWLCQGDKSAAEIRAVRVMIAALWMHNPEAIIAALEPQQARIMENAARYGGGAAVDDAYQAYIAQVKVGREKIIDRLIAEVYTPYAKASQAYLVLQTPEGVAAETDRIWRDIERETDPAWQSYLTAQRRYHETVGRMADGVLDRPGAAFGPRGAAVDRTALRVLDAAETRFIEETGVPPTVTSKAELFTYPRPRAAFEQQAAARLPVALPVNWIYEQGYMKTFLSNMLRTQAGVQWRKTFGDVPPGLPVDAFFVRAKVPPVPSLDTLIMNKDVFMEKQALPVLRENVAAARAQMQRDAPLYANGQALEEKGKNYVRAVYLPAIAMLTSLLIVSITLLRGLAAVLGMTRLNPPQRRGIVAAVVMMIAVVPFLAQNTYTSARAYRVYVAEARRYNPVTATVLDWAVHVQPFIYSAMKGGAGS